MDFLRGVFSRCSAATFPSRRRQSAVVMLRTSGVRRWLLSWLPQLYNPPVVVVPSANVDRSARCREDAVYQPLVIVVAALCAGIVLDRYVPLPPIGVWLTAVGCVVTWRCLHRRRAQQAATVLLLAVALTGAGWHHLCWNLFSINELARFTAADAVPACVEAVALEAPHRLPAPVHSPFRAIPRIERRSVSSGGRARL